MDYMYYAKVGVIAVVGIIIVILVLTLPNKINEEVEKTKEEKEKAILQKQWDMTEEFGHYLDGANIEYERIVQYKYNGATIELRYIDKQGRDRFANVRRRAFHIDYVYEDQQDKGSKIVVTENRDNNITNEKRDNNITNENDDTDYKGNYKTQFYNDDLGAWDDAFTEIYTVTNKGEYEALRDIIAGRMGIDDTDSIRLIKVK